MALNDLTRNFKMAIGMVNYNLTTSHVNAIVKKLDDEYGLDDLTISSVQEITTEVTGYEGYLLTEAVDMSDIELILKQIQRELEKNNKRNIN